MATEIIMPKFGFTLESCKIVQWLVKDGDRVRDGDPLCEVETDKVNMEVEATGSGIVSGIRYAEGDDVPVTEVICYLLAPGESLPTALQSVLAPAAVGAASDAARAPDNGNGHSSVIATPVARRVADAQGVSLETIKGTGPGGRITRSDVEAAMMTAPAVDGGAVEGKTRASPAARRIAREHGIHLEEVEGSGPLGRIQGEDVISALKAMQEHAEQTSSFVPPVEAPAPLEQHDKRQVVPLEGMRRTIARRMQQSFREAPHTFFEISVDTAEIDALRTRMKARDQRLSVTAVIVKACAWALRYHPWLNAHIDGETITLWSTYNIGVAVALENGLIVPVVHAVEDKSLRDIQPVLDDVAGRARRNALRPQDMVDGTFTVSNLGMYGVDRFTAIINPPQVAILAVGRTIQQFVPDANGQPVLKAFMNLMLSTDHRVVDGAQAAQFLADLRAVLENPTLLAW